MSHNISVTALVDDAKTRIKEISVDEVKDKLDANDDFMLIDTREESEWANDHLPKAVHMSRGRLEFMIENLIPERDADIVLYCAGGNRSALAADNLQKMGYTNVTSMADGYRGWKEAGYELI